MYIFIAIFCFSIVVMYAGVDLVKHAKSNTERNIGTSLFSIAIIALVVSIACIPYLMIWQAKIIGEADLEEAKYEMLIKEMEKTHGCR